MSLQLVSIDPKASPRQRRFDQQVRDLLNALLRSGQIGGGPGDAHVSPGNFTPTAVPFADTLGFLSEDQQNLNYDQSDPDNPVLTVPVVLKFNGTFGTGGRPLHVESDGTVSNGPVQLDAVGQVAGVLPVARGGTGRSTSPVLFDHAADAGNVTTGETDLYSDTIAAGQLADDGGDKVSATYGGVFVSSATATRRVRLYFAGTMIFDTGALTLSLSSGWVLTCLVIRVSQTVARYAVDLTTQGAALAAYTAVGELTGLDLDANTSVLKVTGQAGGVGAATNDIVAKLGTVLFTPAA